MPMKLILRSACAVGAEDKPPVAIGKSAELVVIDSHDQESALAELSTPLMGFKRGPTKLLCPK